MTDASQPQLVGSVQERVPTSTANSSRFKAAVSSTGFPVVQHRSKSTFARTRDDKKKSKFGDRREGAPVVISSRVQDRPPGDILPVAPKPLSNSDDWRRQCSDENEKKVEQMTEEEREEERREILERFGGNVGDILKKAREARERNNPTVENETLKQTGEELEGINLRPVSKGEYNLQPPASTPSTSRPSSRADRKLRFADVNPEDVHVYESAPPSPRKKPLALLSRSSSELGDSSVPVISLGDYQSGPKPSKANAEPEEGTPEFIRRRFFPNQPAFDPSLAWMQSAPADRKAEAGLFPQSLRFDLNGKTIPVNLHSTLPTHLGLHHHADGEQAGYTLDDVFLLSRSTVPAQRSSMLGVLARIASQLIRNIKGDYSNGILELKGQEEAIRKRVVAAGIEAMKERGSVGAVAIEVIWECIVHWDDEFGFLDGVELKQAQKPAQTMPSSDDDDSSSRDLINSLPLEEFVLPHISDAFSAAALPRESFYQLLSILQRLARHTNEIANMIVTTPSLISNLFRALLLTPIPPAESTPLPNPEALGLLNTLASASRINATALAEPADALLRFITPSPPSSPYPTALAVSLLTKTLEFYTTLARYGIYSHIATTASIQFFDLHQYVLSAECQSKPLREAWITLMQAWIVCATDPHKTTPGHEILWSQISAWTWGPDLLAFKAQLTSEDGVVWVAVWNCLSAWLEGSLVNGVRAGEAEQASVIQATTPGFDAGVEKEVVTAAFKDLQKILDDEHLGVGDNILGKLRAMAGNSDVLAAALRLWLACAPPYQAGGSLKAPPFSLPFPQLATLSARVVNHPIWSRVYAEGAPSYTHVFCRPMSLFTSYYLRLSRRLPTTSDELWLAQAFVVICRLIPGDEDFGQRTVEEMIKLVSVTVTSSQNNLITQSSTETFTKDGGMEVLTPFLLAAFDPKDDAVRLGPYSITPHSISKSTTQRLPPAYLVGGKEYPLPLSKDWMFTPLNHLLRSGTSAVFNALPTSWDGSEAGMVRATLLFVKRTHQVLANHNLNKWMLSMAETAFGCMKVFMLEHEQHNQDSVEEVFRDGLVEALMGDLLRPFTRPNHTIGPNTPVSAGGDENIEHVATRYLGRSTPFYQYYTDFVNLYDAISFGHPIFSQLLILPTSMSYPVDYRKYLWGDYGHVLRNVRTKPHEMLLSAGGGLSEYLWPVETDPHVLGFFLRGVMRRGALVEDGIMSFIGLHHVASNVWDDLASAEAGGMEEKEKEKAGKLLTAVVDQGSLEAIRDLVRYKQTEGEGQKLLLPPECFGLYKDTDWAMRRWDFIEQVGGESLKERLRPLLEG